MAYQSGRNIAVSYKPEVAFGQLPGSAGAKAFRPNSGNLTLGKEPIRSNEIRRDGMTTRGRHGSRTVTGQYAGDLSVGTFDDLLEAVFRGTFSPALTLTEADFTSLTTTANTIVAASGDWLALGLRVGDVIRLADHASAANNGRNIRIADLSATTIIVADTLTVNAVADTDVSLTRPKKLIQGLVPRSFTVEEHEADIDGSEVFKGVRVGSVQVQMQPNGMCILTFGLVGQDMEVMTGASAPYFTDPAETVSVGLTAVEAKILLGADEVLDISSIDLTLNLNASGVPVVGSVLTPDVFTNLATVEGTITALKQDVARSEQFLNEDVLSLQLLFEEQGGAPADFCSFFLGNFTLATATKGELGQDNARTQSFTLLTGVDERGGAYDRTIIKYQTSAA
ncbi:phage tail tube protein [Paradevosia shaoguanensis]|uniref:Phage tail tube protein n=1 Tax=Paradevosia shaoguanensis TaxID=1335043 RepID=A0AA41QRU5_9HYPH|nr:phage tail tube protein [Paradevosia shaoguanensis]MCI0129212.1 phage tail tube protein [Paradevosia shaoguanensis]